jgi:hypothetical protein
MTATLGDSTNGFASAERTQFANRRSVKFALGDIARNAPRRRGNRKGTRTAV